MNKTWIVYLVHNMVNGKIYVGFTEMSFCGRWSLHCDAAYSGQPYLLPRAIRKYGPENFRYEILATVKTKKEATTLETLWILTLRSYDSKIGYNMTYGGEGGCFASTRQRQGSGMRGKKLEPFIVITNGKRAYRLQKGLPIPEGFVRGRPLRSKEHALSISKVATGKVYITNGVISKKIRKEQTIPEGFWLGKGPQKHAKTLPKWTTERKERHSMFMTAVMSKLTLEQKIQQTENARKQLAAKYKKVA